MNVLIWVHSPDISYCVYLISFFEYLNCKVFVFMCYLFIGWLCGPRNIGDQISYKLRFIVQYVGIIRMRNFDGKICNFSFPVLVQVKKVNEIVLFDSS